MKIATTNESGKASFIPLIHVSCKRIKTLDVEHAVKYSIGTACCQLFVHRRENRYTTFQLLPCDTSQNIMLIEHK